MDMGWHEHQQAINHYFCTAELDQAVLDRWTAPFIPWCGNGFDKSGVKILFVGKSVAITDNEYDAPWAISLAEWRGGGCPDQTAATENYIQLVQQQATNDAFWLVPLLLAGGLLQHVTQYPQVFEHIAWTNLYKITDMINGLPMPGPIDVVSREWLKKEISILSPDVILLGLGPDGIRLFQGCQVDNLPRALQGVEREVLEIPDSSIAWLTWHFSAWANRAERHGDVLFQIRAALQNQP
jgi:hypothetical protein